MSREIKFRAWDEINGVMVYSGDEWRPSPVALPKLKKQKVIVCNDRIIYPYSSPDGSYVRVVGDDGRGSDYYKYWDYDKFFTDGLIFLEYTGIQKHNVEIWQHDIVKMKNGTLNIIYSGQTRTDEPYEFKLQALDKSGFSFDFRNIDKVIGNIHQKPELLETE